MVGEPEHFALCEKGGEQSKLMTGGWIFISEEGKGHRPQLSGWLGLPADEAQVSSVKRA